MEYMKLGQTGLLVSRLSLGTMTFGAGTQSAYAMSTVDEGAAANLVAQALDTGINFFNCAGTYSGGEAEVQFGRAIKGRRDDVIIATKVGFRSAPALHSAGLSRREIIRGAEASLKRLDTDWIDLFEPHKIDPVTPLDEVLEALDRLVQDGKVRYVGLSNWPAWLAGIAIGRQEARRLARFQAAEMFYSLIARDIEHEWVPLMQHSGVGLLAWSPLAGGLLSGKYTREDPTGDGGRLSRTYRLPLDGDKAYDVIELLRTCGARSGATPAQAAIAWLLAKPHVTSVLIGASNPKQLADNVAAVKLRLAPEDLARLDEATQPPELYPHWFSRRNADAAVAAALQPRQ